jgi:hypothetical protein
MQHVNLGRTGLRVSHLCLGMMTFGLLCDESRSHAILDAAAEGGIDFIGTAPKRAARLGISAAGSARRRGGSTNSPSPRLCGVVWRDIPTGAPVTACCVIWNANGETFSHGSSVCISTARGRARTWS